MIGVKYKVPLLIVIFCITSRTFSQDLSSKKPDVVQELPTPLPEVAQSSSQGPPLIPEVVESTTPSIAPTMSPEKVCETHNSSCGACVDNANAKCVYCHSSGKCIYYPYSFPPKKIDCKLSDANWGTCLVNMNILIIVLSSLAGVLVLAFIICCCCCCRKHGRNKWARQLQKWEQERKDMKKKHEERRQERQLRTDEIRKKYGLFKEDNPYSRFDD